MNIRAIAFSLLLIASIVFSWDISAQNRYKAAVDEMLSTYPQSAVTDIYKSFFQDRFGPGHLIADTVSARAYLRSELANMGESSLPYFEPVGVGENYFSVSLALIKDSVVSEDDFFNAFIESASKRDVPSVENWADEWAEILKLIPPSIDNYAADVACIDSLLSAGKYVMRHSRRFNEAYNPHYRLIDKSVFNVKLLPHIQKRTPKKN